MIEISKEDFKKQMLDMHARGYREGYEDVKKSTIEALTAYKIIQNNKPFTIDEMIEFIQKVNTNF